MRSVDAGPLLATNGDSEFIFAAYHELFGRLPDIDGLLDHRFLLKVGLTREIVLNSLAQSEEGRACRVVLTDLPQTSKRGLFSRLVFLVRLRVQWVLWRVLDRPSEAVEQRIHMADPARFWDLTYQATSTLIHRQQIFEAQLHLWRREMEEDSLKVQAALHRLSEYAADQQIRPASSQAGEIHFDGMSFSLPPQEWDHLGRVAFSRQVPPGLAALLRRVVTPGMVIADAGAGAGAFSVFVSRAIQPGGKLYALEPRPEHFALLLRNLESNGHLKSGACVALPNTAGASNGAALFDGAAVPQVTLDSVLAAEPRVDLVRLSLHGAEAAAIEGMWRLLSSNPSLRIVFDCHPDLLAGNGADAASVLDRLAKAGFLASRVCPMTGTLLPMPEIVSNEPLIVLLERNASTGEKQA